MEPGRRRAFCIFYGEMDGAAYDFDAGRWKERETS
jgi:hypothetical protein